MRIRWEVSGSGSVALGVAEGVITKERNFCSGTNVEVRDQLILAEDSVGSILIEGRVWRRSSGAGQAWKWRIGDEREKLVDAARVEIRNGKIGDLGDLALHAERCLHDV